MKMLHVYYYHTFLQQHSNSSRLYLRLIRFCLSTKLHFKHRIVIVANNYKVITASHSITYKKEAETNQLSHNNMI